MTHARDHSKAIADRWLSLAAAPTFAAMALLAAVGDGDVPLVLCSTAYASPLTGMVTMYMLMCVFHSAPWLTRIAIWRSGGKRPSYEQPPESAPNKCLGLIGDGRPVD